MGCRRLLGALCRAVIMAGLEAGLSQGALPAGSAHRLSAQVDTQETPSGRAQTTHCWDAID